MQANEKWMVWNKIVVVGDDFEMSLMMDILLQTLTEFTE